MEMGADGVADAPKTTGKLKYELVDGQTAATYVYATYPLKFLHPRGTVRQGFGTYVTVCLCCRLQCMWLLHCRQN
jgi:hypothetical protein